MNDKSNQNNNADLLSLMLESAQRFHESILSHLRSLDTKGSILLATFTVLLLPVTANVEFNLCPKGILSLASLAAVVIGIVESLLTLFLAKYTIPPKLTTLQRAYEDGWPTEKIQAQLFANFKKASLANKVIGAKKILHIRKGYIFIYISLLLFLITEFLERLQ